MHTRALSVKSLANHYALALSKKADSNGHTRKANTEIQPQHSFVVSSDRSAMTHSNLKRPHVVLARTEACHY